MSLKLVFKFFVHKVVDYPMVGLQYLKYQVRTTGHGHKMNFLLAACSINFPIHDLIR